MNTPANPEDRALIPAPSQSLFIFRRPLPISQRTALGIAAGAVSTIFVKRLVELVAEDLYRRLRRGARLPIRRAGSPVREKEQADPILPADPPEALEPARTGVFFVQVVQVRRRLRLGSSLDRLPPL